MREFKDAVTGKEDEVPKTELTPPPTNTTSATTGPTEPAAEPSETERVSS
jgi:hypothetical protein